MVFIEASWELESKTFQEKYNTFLPKIQFFFVKTFIFIIFSFKRCYIVDMEGLKIKEFLERKGIRRQKDLANELGVSDQTVSNWANGETFPTHEMEDRLLRMGMTIEELFGQEIWKIVKMQAQEESKSSADETFERKAAFFMNKLFDKIDKMDLK